MANRRWFANDGQTHFDTKAEADEYDARHDLLLEVAKIANGTPETILRWFEENFRVRQPRKPRTSPPPVPTPVPSSSATATDSVLNINPNKGK